MNTSKKLLPKQKLALVTGAGKRIGREIALCLAGEGYDLAIHCNASRVEADDLQAQLHAAGHKAEVFVADLSNRTAVAALIPQIAAAMGPVSLLVNCASMFEFDEMGQLGADVWQRHMAINLEAPVFLTQNFAAQAPEGGSVVNIIDQRVWKLTPQFFSYTLSKAALWTATQTMAQALAPRVRINAVGPGPTLPSVRQQQADFDAQVSMIPLEHAASPHDIAEAVLYLARAQSVTGQMIAVDGGQHLAWRTPDVISGAE